MIYRIRYLLLVFILLTSLIFRFYINYFIPVNQPINPPAIFAGLINLILLFVIIRQFTNYRIGLLAALLYALSPWTAYLELAASPHIFLLTILSVIFRMSQMFNINKKYSSVLLITAVTIYILIFNQIKIFSNVGLINAVNSFRGETNQTAFSPLGKIIENRYLYLSEHILFNILKQFTPATYFTNQAQLLGFSFSPPIFLGFIIPFMFGLIKLIKSFPRSKIPEVILIAFLLLPSILSENSPDISSLVVISPVIFYVISSGMYEFILNSRRKVFRFLLFLTILIVTFQFLTTISDIASREPVRLQMFLNRK